jgi:tetratricopeptide (TPR) repeat protein
MIGRTLGHYRIVEQIGSGGMGVVYRARDDRLQRDVAIKVLPHAELADEDARRRFRHEALSLSRASHPNIATIHDFDVERDVAYIVMEYVPGETLSQHLRQRGPLPAPEILRLGCELVEGVGAAHREGVIHRDLKPGNIRLTTDGHVKILDFGIAQWSAAGDAETLAGDRMAGTLPYMAPEQARGESGDVRSDVYAVGAVLYEMATGHRAVRGRNNAETLDGVLHRMPPSPRSIGRSIPEALEACIFKALDKNAQRRYQSARELLVDLERIAEGRAAAPVEAAAQPGRLRWGAAAPLLALAALVASAVVYVRNTGAPPGSAATADTFKLAVLPAQLVAAKEAPTEWRELVQTLFADQLTGVQKLGVADSFSLRGLVGSPSARGGVDADDVQQRLRAASIRLVVESQIMRQGNGYELRASVHDLEAQEREFSDRATFLDENSLDQAVSRVAENIITFLQLQFFNLGADQNLRPWLSLRNRNIQAVKAFSLANDYSLRDQPEEAQRYLLRAMELDPNYIAPRIWRIPSLLARGARDEAEAEYQRLLELQPRASPFEQAMIAYIRALLRGNVDEQIRQLEICLTFTPGNFILLNNLGFRQATKGDCRKALDTLEPLVASRWSFLPLYPLWGWCALNEGRLERVLEVLSALELPPGRDSTTQVLALIEAALIAAGREGEAKAYEARLAHSNPPLAGSGQMATLYDRLADRAFGASRYLSAALLWQKAVVQQPKMARYRDRLAEALFRQGRTRDAERAYHEALAADPNLVHAYLGLAEIAEQRGDWQAAAGHYRTVVAKAPDGPEGAVARERLDRITSGSASLAPRR